MIGPDLTESPIEKMLYDALAEWESLEGDLGHEVICQQVVSGYRVDFCVKCWGQIVLVVECDGHEWHEKTKKQAARDKRRDRQIFYEHSVTTIRFTGSEIYRDAEGCAQEVRGCAHQVFADMAMRYNLEISGGAECHA